LPIPKVIREVITVSINNISRIMPITRATEHALSDRTPHDERWMSERILFAIE